MILAIKGHATRGKEVIQLLEMLGGKNIHNSWGVFESRIYTIDEKTNEIIDVSKKRHYSNYNLFTLEEFEKLYPYKVGDIVEVCETGKVLSISNMIWEDELSTVHYGDMEDIVYYTADELQPHKEPNMNKKLAIKGHKTRGKKVIRLLEMLGGKNIHNYVGTSNECYTIDNNTICTIYTSVAKIDNCVIFTLEEFEEKFPYKVGDKVITKDKFIGTIRDIRWQGDIVYTVQVSTTAQITYQKEDLQPYKEELTMKNKSKLINIQPKLVGNECVHFPIPTNMKLEVKDGMCYLYRDCGEQCKREGVNLQKMERKLDEALEKETKESLEEFFFGDPEPEPKAPILSNRYDYAEGKCGYVIPDGYEFDCIKEGFQTEIILKPKKPTYPKDYKECCEVLGYSGNYNIILTTDIDCKLFNALYRLKVCRDAYWKLAGKEMGLDKPWEPDWDNLSTTHEFIKINKGCFTHSSRVLVFPTPEMRDAFYENFKDLIEQCKEVL